MAHDSPRPSIPEARTSSAIHHKPTRPAPGPNFVPSPLVRRKLAEMRPKIAVVKRAVQNGSPH